MKRKKIAGSDRIGLMMFRFLGILIVLFTSELGTPELLTAEGGGGLDSTMPGRTFSVDEVDLSGFLPPEGSFDLLREKLVLVILKAGGYRRVEGGAEADISLQAVVVSYSLDEEPDLGYVVNLEMRLEIEGAYRDLAVLRTIGTGESPYAAAVRAVDEMAVRYLFHLGETDIWESAARLVDMVAGRAIVNRGAKAGVRRGTEFESAEGSGEPFLLRIAEVYADYSEGHVLRGDERILSGSPVRKVKRLGLKSSLSVYHVRILPDENAIVDPDALTRTWAVGTRTWFEAGLFSLSPFVAVDYIGQKASFLSLGMGLNWYFGRFTCVPAAGGRVGLSGSSEDGLFWGGFAEMGFQWLVRKNVLVTADIGLSSLFYAGTGDEDLEFLYSGVGLILKY